MPSALPYLLRDLPVQERAERIFSALQALDEHEIEREELRASGVAEHSIGSLYPFTFAALLPGFVKHLEDHPDSVFYSQARARALDKKVQEISVIAADVLDEWVVAFREAEADLDLLRNRLYAMQKPDVAESTSRMVVGPYANVLWNAWWLMQNYEALSERWQPSVHWLMITSCWALFPQLREHDEA